MSFFAQSWHGSVYVSTVYDDLVLSLERNVDFSLVDLVLGLYSFNATGLS